ncbi:21981_t:CDS:1, partial [Gigaspora margarita]
AIQPKIDEISLDSLPETGDIWEMESDPALFSNIDPSAEIFTETVSDDTSSSVSTTNVHDSIQNTMIEPRSGEVQGQVHTYLWERPIYINKYKYYWGTKVHYHRKILLHHTYRDNKFYKICYAYYYCRFSVTTVKA